jgi:hypothetical protein
MKIESLKYSAKSVDFAEGVLLFDNKDFLITNLETITKSDVTIRYIIEMKEL